MIQELYTGTATISTSEISLITGTTSTSSDTQDGVIQCFIDLNALASGDTVEFRAYEKTRSSDTQRLVFAQAFSDTQSEPVWASPALIMMHGWDFRLIRTGGTSRTITWSIRKT
jgi:hypothetical protein